METSTLSCVDSERVLGLISADRSLASIVSKSTKASSGSTLLMSIPLVLALSSDPRVGRRSLGSTLVQLLSRRTRDDSQSSNLFRPRFSLGIDGRLVPLRGGGQ